MASKYSPLKAAETAIRSIGLGYDISADLRLKACKWELPDPCLIELDQDHGQEIVVPGGISISNVPTSIKCDKGERMRFRSDVLSFQQVRFLIHVIAGIINLRVIIFSMPILVAIVKIKMLL